MLRAPVKTPNNQSKTPNKMNTFQKLSNLRILKPKKTRLTQPPTLKALPYIFMGVNISCKKSKLCTKKFKKTFISIMGLLLNLKQNVKKKGRRATGMMKNITSCNGYCKTCRNQESQQKLL